MPKVPSGDLFCPSWSHLNVGVLGQVVEERGQRVGRGLVAGDEEDDALGSDDVVVQDSGKIIC